MPAKVAAQLRAVSVIFKFRIAIHEPDKGAEMLTIPPMDAGKIREICQRYPIRRLALFGSILHEDFGPSSDVDVLVEWQPGAIVGFRVFELESELSETLGNRPIDLVNVKYLEIGAGRFSMTGFRAEDTAR
jgi:predicted nucleotidyltransferase